MAYSESAGLVDLFDGTGDLERGLIRCVGDPLERFTEDALRMLRAMRFSAQLDFVITEDVREAMRSLAPRIEMVSAERIREELTKTLVSDHPERIAILTESGLGAYVLPEFDALFDTPQRGGSHYGSVGVHTLDVVKNTPAAAHLRWTALLHDIGKPSVHVVEEQRPLLHDIDKPSGQAAEEQPQARESEEPDDLAGTPMAAAEQEIPVRDRFPHHGKAGAWLARTIMERLKFDRATMDRVEKLVAWHDYPFDMTKADVRRVMHGLGRELFPDLLAIARADNLAKRPEVGNFLLDALDRVEELYGEVVRDNDPIDIRDLAVGGRDLIQAGIAPGQQMGHILQQLLEEVLEDPARNERETLLARAGELAAAQQAPG